MTLKLVTIPCLSDNYAYLLHDAANNQTAIVDAPEARPIMAALAQNGWTLTHILLTHHHDDHIGAVPELRSASGAMVVGAKADSHRLPSLDLAVSDGDTFQFGSETCHVLDVSGHTVGHIAFHFPQSAMVFTADSLMALGCGRLFEGTATQMWTSLSRLMALPGETLVCSGHEYTAANAKFALTVDPDNPALKARAARIEAARAENQPTVPSRLSDELDTNPFLRASDPGIRANLGMQEASDVEVFTEIRARKDAF